MKRRFIFAIFGAGLALLPARGRAEGPGEPLMAEVQKSTESVKDPLLTEARGDLEAGQVRQARRKLNSFLDKQPTSAEGWTLLGRTYLATGDNSKALSRFQKALKFDPHYAPAFTGRGEVFEKRGHLDEAANEFRAAVLSDPNEPEARQALARLNQNAPSPE
ncbi:MAG: tetratricopeptide repeat protein [Elusimicrobia bacterium]|nr:tetratricopeptide repeat protein [Elusimicrobiota bacterium]